MNALPGWITPEGELAASKKWAIQSIRNFQLGQSQDELFFYNIDFGALAHGKSALAFIDVEKDVTYYCTSIAHASHLDGTNTDTRNPITVQIIDGGMSKNLFNQAAPLYCIASANIGPSSGGFSLIGTVLPHQLAIPKIFLPRSRITFIATNIDTAVDYTDVTITLAGIKKYNVPPRGAKRTWQGNDGKLYTEDFYAYVATLPTLAQGATATVSFVTEGDSDFEWDYLMGTSQPRGGNTGSFSLQGAFSVMITDSASQRPLFSQAAGQGAVCGQGSFPSVLAVGRIFESKSKVDVTITNIDSADAIDNIYIVMEGRKIYQVPE